MLLGKDIFPMLYKCLYALVTPIVLDPLTLTIDFPLFLTLRKLFRGRLDFKLIKLINNFVRSILITKRRIILIILTIRNTISIFFTNWSDHALTKLRNLVIKTIVNISKWCFTIKYFNIYIICLPGQSVLSDDIPERRVPTINTFCSGRNKT